MEELEKQIKELKADLIVLQHDYKFLEQLYEQALKDYDEQLRINEEHRIINGCLQEQLKKEAS